MTATVTASVAQVASNAAEQLDSPQIHPGAMEQKALEKRQRDRGLNDSVSLEQASETALSNTAAEPSKLARSAVQHYTESMAETARDRVLNVRLTDAEVGMLGELAGHEALSVSDWVRMTIRVEHARTFRPRPRKKGKARDVER